ncbi:MAG TPA: glycerol-3-phosphate acyltransferase [Ignavibacteria bacterium]|nr:glycerol-3-phosphate acyltransferase [Ignavibacteria bacterium]HQY52368.1 glycerol-3-phosphate acyltransferase [Ignavibacteria bacterium]HRA99338.1 glycerol-3-phosphate acyltransferase [Ignavibacteria bacterium]
MFYIYCLVFYLIGSIPTAYILVKLKYKKNLTEEGSGNIGARNTLDVTQSKSDGVIVLLVDLLKGLLPSLFLIMYSELNREEMIIPLTLLVAGHNFSIWLKFKGGRGLSTAAGVFIAVDFLIVLIWLAAYFLAEVFVKNVNVSTVIALLILPLAFIIFPGFILNFINPLLTGYNEQAFCLILVISVCTVIILKHIKPLREWWFIK